MASSSAWRVRRSRCSAHRTEGKDTTVKAQVGGDGFNGPSTFTFQVEGDRVARMTIRA